MLPKYFIIIILYIPCCFGLAVAPSSIELDVLVNQTYSVQLFSPDNLMYVSHDCPFNATLSENILVFELNEFATNGSVRCFLYVSENKDSLVKAQLNMLLHIQKEEFVFSTYEFIHYTTFNDVKKGRVTYENLGNIVLYPTIISGNESESFIILPGETKIFWFNLSDSYLLDCQLDCEVLLPTEYIQLDKPDINLELEQFGDGSKVLIRGLVFPVTLLLDTSTETRKITVSQDGEYYYEGKFLRVSIVYDSIILASTQLPVNDTNSFISLKFILFVSLFLIIFTILFFLQQKKS